MSEKTALVSLECQPLLGYKHHKTGCYITKYQYTSPPPTPPLKAPITKTCNLALT
jgi:hypothetical protein